MLTIQTNLINRFDAACHLAFDTTASHCGLPGASFTSGTRIDVASGTCAVEHIVLGDLLQTLDDGLQPVRSVRRETQRVIGDAAPVLFETGSIGNSGPILMAADQRILISDWRAELFLGCDEVLVAARDLVNGRDIRVVEGAEVSFIQLSFERIQIVFAQGCAFECSRSQSTSRAPAVRMVARPPEAVCLMAA